MGSKIDQKRLEYFLDSPGALEYSLAEQWMGLKPNELARAIRDEFAARFLGGSIGQFRIEDEATKLASNEGIKYEDLGEADKVRYNLKCMHRAGSFASCKVKMNSWYQFDRAMKTAIDWVCEDDEAIEFWDRVKYVVEFIRKSPVEQQTHRKRALENKYKGYIPPSVCSLKTCRFCWRLVPVPQGRLDIYCEEHDYCNMEEANNNTEDNKPEAKYHRSKDKRYRRKMKLRQLSMNYGFVDVDGMELSLRERLYGGGWGELEREKEHLELIKNYEQIEFILQQSKIKNEYPEVSLLLECLPEVSKYLDEKNISVSSMFELGDVLNATSVMGVDSILFERGFKDHFEVIEYFAKIEVEKDLMAVDDIFSFQQFLKYSESDPRSFEEVHRSSIIIDLYYRCFASAEAWLLLNSACKHGGKRENAGRKRKNDETDPS